MKFAQASSGNHWAIGVMQWNARNDSQDSFWSVECNTVSLSPKRDYAISAGASNFDGELDLDGLSSNRISSTIGNKQDFEFRYSTEYLGNTSFYIQQDRQPDCC